MKKQNGFEDLEIWKMGVALSISACKLLLYCNDYGLKDQMQRSIVSVPSNIAEGYERLSSKERIYFLNIAKGSCGEFRTQLYIAHELSYIGNEDFEELLQKAKMLSVMINNFMQYQKSLNKH